jgi:hypothetical protein
MDQVSIELTKQWGTMSDDEKAPYIQMYEDN